MKADQRGEASHNPGVGRAARVDYLSGVDGRAQRRGSAAAAVASPSARLSILGVCDLRGRQALRRRSIPRLVARKRLADVARVN